MEHVPILVAMPSWCLPDQGMLKVVSLAPKPQWITKTKIRDRDRKRWTQKSHDATYLPSSTSQKGKLLIAGWCLQDDNFDITHGNHSARREYRGNMGRKLTFESQSCRSCETTRFSKPCRVILTSSILTRNIIK